MLRIEIAEKAHWDGSVYTVLETKAGQIDALAEPVVQTAEGTRGVAWEVYGFRLSGLTAAELRQMAAKCEGLAEIIDKRAAKPKPKKPRK